MGGEADAYRRLFAANALGLVATGIATVALALLAFELAGDEAAAVLGTALSIKMAVNVLVAPLASAWLAGVPRRGLLALLAVARAGALFLLPFVGAVWQVWALIALFQVAAASAAAVYQAAVPDLLPDPEDYARAVGKSKIAYEAETLLSPALAALLLLAVDHRGVFVVSVVLFVLSAAALRGVRLPDGRRRARALAAAADDLRRLVAAPAMRGALLLGAASLTVGAMVTVNTVVLVRGLYDLDDTATAAGLAAFGGGGIVAALLLARLLRRSGERRLMLTAGMATGALLALGPILPGYVSMLALWVALGAATTLAQLPMATMIRRLAPAGERQGLYAAHYAITHAVLAAAYLAAGWVGAEAGLAAAFLGLGAFSLALVAIAARVWPRDAAAGRSP